MKRIKLACAALAASFVFSAPVATMAAGISTATILSDWTVSNGPLGGSPSWTSSGGRLLHSGNGGGAVASDFIQTGDFMFSARLQNSGDNDTYGIAFGWTDTSNHYRLSFNGGGISDVFGDGVFLIREQGGVNTNLASAATTWANGQQYDLMVARTGSTISASVTRVSDSAVLFSTSLMDTTFTTGSVALWNESQPTFYDNVDFTSKTGAVPVPAALPLALSGVAALVALGRRKRSAA